MLSKCIVEPFLTLGEPEYEMQNIKAAVVNLIFSRRALTACQINSSTSSSTPPVHVSSVSI